MTIEIAKTSYNFLMIAGIILGISFVINTLCSKRGKHKSVIYLSLVILFLTLNNIQIVLVESGFLKINDFVRKLLIPWYLLIFPSFYTFLTYYLKIEKKLFSFVPLAVGLFLTEIIIRIVLIPIYFDDTDVYIIARYTQIEEIINAAFSVFLYAKAFILLFQYANLYQYVLSYDNLKWLKIFLALGCLVILLWLTAILSNIDKVMHPEIYIYYPMRLTCSIFLYWIGYQGFFNYNILTQRVQIREDIAFEKNQTKVATSIISKPLENKETQPSLKVELAQQILIIKNHIENNNRYLDTDFSLEILASEIKMSTSTVSSIINNQSDFNFSDYINVLRIEKAKTFLLTPKYKHYNIEAIGFECGFNSKSAFYMAFKKFTNTTPLDFKKQNSQF
jgi:AraC-like DNA-binding protein